MTLRSQLSAAIEALDSHPEIETKTISKPVLTALKNFEAKFKDLVVAKTADRKWEEMRSDLVRLSPEHLGRELGSMRDETLLNLCKFFGFRSIKATKKLSARENAEAKVIKKIKEIAKQLH